MIRKTIFYLSGFILWLLVAAMGLEAFERVRVHILRPKVEAHYWQRWGEGKQREAEIDAATRGNAPVPPASVRPRPGSPKRETYASLADDAARLEFARRRNEIVLPCDRAGRILAKYVAEDPPSLLALARLAEPGDSFARLLPSTNGQDQDGLAAFRSVAGGGFQQFREYPCLLPDGRPHIFEFYFFLAKETSEPVLITIRESLYEELWRKMRPHVYRDDTFGPWTLWTNNVGFRDEEVVLPKPPGIYRILCIGGSTTFEGVRNDLTYPNILEKKLRVHFGTDLIEVVNCGINGMTSLSERERAPDFLALQPDLVIHYNFANDMNNVIPAAYRMEATSPGWLARVRPVLRKSLFATIRFPDWVAPARSSFRAVIPRFLMNNVERLACEMQKAGVDIVLCSFACPDMVHLDRLERYSFMQPFNPKLQIYPRMDDYVRAIAADNELLRELCARLGVFYVPVAEELLGGTDLFTDNCHLHQEAIERKADIIFRHLRDYLKPRLVAKGVVPAS